MQRQVPAAEEEMSSALACRPCAYISKAAYFTFCRIRLLLPRYLNTYLDKRGVQLLSVKKFDAACCRHVFPFTYTDPAAEKRIIKRWICFKELCQKRKSPKSPR